MDLCEISKHVALVQNTVVFLKLLQDDVLRCFPGVRADQGLHVGLLPSKLLRKRSAGALPGQKRHCIKQVNSCNHPSCGDPRCEVLDHRTMWWSGRFRPTRTSSACSVRNNEMQWLPSEPSA